MNTLAFLKTGATIAAASLFSIFGGHVTATAPRPAIATTTSAHQQVNIACVASAVAMRESALDSAVTTRDNAITSAYTARAAALAAAYGQTATSSIQSGIKSAWNTFNSSVKSARGTWRGARQSAWQAYATALKSCGASVSTVGDLSHESDDTADGD